MKLNLHNLAGKEFWEFAKSKCIASFMGKHMKNKITFLLGDFI